MSDCVRFYFEVDDDVVSSKGGAAGATNYVTGIYNQVAALYANESINTVVSEIFNWTTNSPYSSTTSSGMLSQFQSYRNNWNGDLYPSCCPIRYQRRHRRLLLRHLRVQ
ncbi:MAG: hypothetical protein H6559_20060 [Lewinellaceae bacterium]|nr:hypothetical protein [Lewinellaceae bacterium]